MRVAADQLLATANGWHGLTSELLTTATPSELGFSSQASAAAVDAVHAGLPRPLRHLPHAPRSRRSKPLLQASLTPAWTQIPETYSAR
ncbi:hypothetical protein I552_0204 [Mycobacterium xenopi 3993]|nr:hypothetical protein I552_0204 [Mycobacterium xenopi 3993]